MRTGSPHVQHESDQNCSRKNVLLLVELPWDLQTWSQHPDSKIKDSGYRLHKWVTFSFILHPEEGIWGWILEPFHNNRSDRTSQWHFRTKHFYPPALTAAETQWLCVLVYISGSQRPTRALFSGTHRQCIHVWIVRKSNTQLSQGTKALKSLVKLYIWTLNYQRVSSQRSLRGWQSKFTQWYTKILSF